MKFDRFLGDICASKLKKMMKGRAWEIGRRVLLIGLRKCSLGPHTGNHMTLQKAHYHHMRMGYSRIYLSIFVSAILEHLENSWAKS